MGRSGLGNPGTPSVKLGVRRGDARRAPLPLGARGDALSLLATGAAATLLTLPFRIPRHWIEVALIPAIVNLMAVAWIAQAAALAHRPPAAPAPVAWGRPALALLALLAVFQLILRPGIAL